MQRPSREIDWNNLGFGKIFGDHKFEKRYNSDRVYSSGIVPYSPILLDPAAGVLNYGDGLIGGLRAQTTPHGEIIIFQLKAHAERMARDAQHYSMPLEANDFIEAVVQTVRANEDFVPPYTIDGRKFLYIRPQLWGSGINFTIGVSPETTFSIIVTPCETFTKTPYKVIAYPLSARADACRKTITNYSPYNPLCRVARAQGFSQILHLDPTGTFPEEVGPANVFFVLYNGSIITPSLKRKSILPGITRSSIITIARHLDFEVTEVDWSLKDILPKCAEAFACGTAVGITPIDEIFNPSMQEWGLENDKAGCVHYQEYAQSHSPQILWKLSSSHSQSTSHTLRKALISLQATADKDVFGWNYQI